MHVRLRLHPAGPRAGLRLGPAPVRPPRTARRLAVRAFREAEVPTWALGSELRALQQHSTLLLEPESLEQALLQGREAPPVAVTSRAVLGGILNSPPLVGARRFKTAVEQALVQPYNACSILPNGQRAACQTDRALVNVGMLLLERGNGVELGSRVSTEVDPRVARDEDAVLEHGRRLVEMYEEAGVPRNRVLLRIPATWEGIQAAKQLEAEGITTHLVLVYSFVQGAAAARAGVSLIQVDVGKLDDWYDHHPGYIRNPKAPQGFQLHYHGKLCTDQPGLLLVERLYNYTRQLHPHTRLAASGIRTAQEALALSGCDYMLLPPAVVEELRQQPTLEGYNDGLCGAAAYGESSPAPRLTPARARLTDFSANDLEEATERSFRSGLGKPTQDLLAEGLEQLVEDVERLEPHFEGIVSGQT